MRGDPQPYEALAGPHTLVSIGVVAQDDPTAFLWPWHPGSMIMWFQLGQAAL